MAPVQQPRYLKHGPFHEELHRRVDQHFVDAGIDSHGRLPMLGKTLFIYSWLIGSYLLLMFWASSVWTAVPLAVSIGLAMAGIGFNVQHDGGHGGYSRRKGLNRLMAYSLDSVGGSSYVWSWKHNVFHHSNPNISGLDEDIDIEPFCRLSPLQPHRPVYRFQHLYIWLLYALLALKWHFVDDFKDVISGSIGSQPFPRPKRGELAALLLGKLFFYSWAVVLPFWLHPFGAVLALHLVASVTVSLALAITFQLAHCVEGAAFAGVDPAGKGFNREWAVHQVAASANFAPHSRFLTSYLGGLNFQIEHHLFPRVCHQHLRALAPLVEEICRKHSVPYQVHPSMRAALASHARWVHRLSLPDPAGPLAREVGPVAAH